MTRLAMPDRACVGVEIEGARTGAVTGYYDRIVEVDNPQHEKVLRAYGCFPVNVGGRPKARGFACTGCGRKSYFTTCGRCGAACNKET